MRAFLILSCLALAASKPQYNYEQPAAQYYTSNVVQQQYPAGAYVGQQQQLLPAVSAYQNQGAYIQQSLPVSYASLGSTLASQPQTAAYPSQNIYTSYAQSPSYQGLIASPAPGVSYTGYTGYTSLQSAYPSNAQTSFVQGQVSNNGYYNNVYSQTVAPEQTYLPAAYTAVSANDNNANVGTLEQFPNQHEQLQATQAPVQQSATIDQSATSVSSQSSDLAQQHLSVDHESPESLHQSQEQLSLPEPSPLPQVDSTPVSQLEQSFQSGYHQTIQNQPAQTYLPAGNQQSYQSQPEHSYQSGQQSYQVQPQQSQQSVDVQQSVEIQPEKNYQSVQQTYENQPAQTYLAAGVQQSFQNQPEHNYQSAQQSYQAEQAQNLQSVEVQQSVQSQSEQSYQSAQQSYQVQPAQTYLPAEVQQSFQSQPEQSYQSVQQTYQTEAAQNHQSVGVQQSFQSQPEHNYQSVQQTYQAQPEQNVQSELQQSFQNQPEHNVQTQSEQVYQSQAVHSITTHQQTFEPQTQSETEPRAHQPAVETTIHKSIYVHVPPKELEEEDFEPLPVQPISPPKKHYKVIFIKAPSPAASRQIIQQIQPQDEEKTIVYVLVKKPEAPELVHLQQPEIKPTNKPEVYFIKYRTQKDIEQVPAVEPTIQAVPALQSIETAPLASESTIIEPRQKQPTQPPQFPALEEQNNLLSTEVANDEVQIPATTRRPHHHLRLNSSKHLQKSGARKPAKDYLPANLN